MKDSQIIASFKKDDQRAIEQLYGHFRPKFMNWLKGTYRIGSQEEAGEIYQRSFTILYMQGKKGKLGEIRSSIETYLYGIAKYQVLEFQREQQKNVDSIEVEGVSEEEMQNFLGVFEAANVDDSLVRKIQKELSELGDPCRTILRLFYWKGYSMEAIARETGYKNESVAKKKKYGCLQKLKQKMKGT
ncbi:MAG: RNA polymerase sigma factor [Fluviicola sp.]